MTNVEHVAKVRARLESMITLAQAASESDWYEEGHSDLRPMDNEDSAFVIAANPKLLHDVAREALSLLDRHSPGGTCRTCRWGEDVPCPEVASILRAWLLP